MGKNVGKMAGKGGNQGSWHNTKTPSTPSSCRAAINSDFVRIFGFLKS